MLESMRPAAIVAALFVCACGGADAQNGTAKTAHGSSARGGGEDDSIADVASREGLPSLGGAGSQSGGGTSGALHLELVDKDNPIHFDGTVKEWSLVQTHAVKGVEGSIGFKCALAYDSQYVYFASEVTGVSLRHLRRFVDDEDHASLVIAAPSSPPVELLFFAGKPGESVGVVRTQHGRDVPGAKIVEAENDKGYTFEASIPWSAIAPPTIRVGLRGVARFFAPVTSGTSGASRAIFATGNGDAQSPQEMPALPTAIRRSAHRERSSCRKVCSRRRRSSSSSRTSAATR